MDLLKRPGQRLQWKLTLSALLTTVVTVCLIEIITVIVILIYFFAFPNRIWLNNVQSLANQATPFFVNEHPDRAELAKWLQISNNSLTEVPLHSPVSFLAVVDQQGNVLIAQGGDAQPQLHSVLSKDEQQQLQRLLQGKNTSQGLSFQDEPHISVLMAPIVDGQRVEGAIILRSDQLTNVVFSANFSNLLPLIVLNVIVITVLAALTGAIAGFLTARGFTRRFRRLSLVADQWSQGDFLVRTIDTSEDELGQLTRQLNNMAGQLQQFLRTRQQLATLEERNRLARDLHDSVKQQVFVVAMQVGAIRLLMGKDVAAARKRLDDMEQLVREIQKELSALILELRPVALEGRSLAQALQAYIKQWQDQTWIASSVEVEETCAVSPALEEALFRIAQEALANVARHSNATQVQVHLRCTEELVTLQITDNGKGFQPEKREKHGVGLMSMQERIRELGGQIKIDSASGKGTQIHIECAATPV
ncbi:HAMP domain-containing sensor histidine kinase [Dictyobacter formicarum]|uniref:histidine kinase n=1 Tax=Dictyobacter formicarum TaxID=2778368 RepID=A0ABQ3VR76_9CHLR|nr:sensor histidine kinase [Dictyobacter formicarum]GHO88333.1 hypothetical protein KSZ_63390 [Dictyobacter formicarum]